MYTCYIGYVAVTAAGSSGVCRAGWGQQHCYIYYIPAPLQAASCPQQAYMLVLIRGCRQLVCSALRAALAAALAAAIASIASCLGCTALGPGTAPDD